MSASPPEDFTDQLTLAEYPRSAAYDADWVIENMMGPNPLWLTEALTAAMALRPNDRVLDLGCGKALSSIFLAKEFGVDVEAVDLWVEADDNQTRIQEAGVSDLVHPVHADAMSLPFEMGTFDAIVSVDAYHYFGTRPEVLSTVSQVLRPGGQIGIVVPGLAHEVGRWPEHLKPWWQDGFETFHSPEWWSQLWEASGLVEVERADWVPNGARDWLKWSEACDAWALEHGRDPYEKEVEMLRADKEHLLGFSLIVAKTRERISGPL